MAEFRMPALGADMEAGVLVAWLRKPGDALQRGDVIAEVETDKGVIEVEVFVPGVLERYLVEPGQKVPVGAPLAILSDPGQPAAVAPSLGASPAPPPAQQRSSEPLAAAPSPPPAAEPVRAPPSLRKLARELGVDVGELVARSPRASLAELAPVAQPVAARAGLTDTGSATQPVAPPVAADRLRASPAARKRAQELGLELHALRGTGPEGAIVLEDVERAWLSSRSASQPSAPGERLPPAAASDGSRRALRRAIAAAMTRSKREIPHYYLTTAIDLARMTAWLRAYNRERSVSERMLAGALLLKSVARAAKQLPDFNCLWQQGAAQPMPDVHLGVAIALRGGGLVAPAIHHADTLELPVLMSKLNDLVTRARGGSLRSSELSDGTITVTSLGERGVDSVQPIIYAPQTAIVGFGRIAERPWVVDSALAVRPLVTASLAADHRVTDGHVGARFLNLVDQLLQDPEHL